MVGVNIAGSMREVFLNPDKIVKVYKSNGFTVIQLDVYDPAEQKWEEIVSDDSIESVLEALEGKNGNKSAVS